MVQEEGFSFYGAFQEGHRLVGVLGAREGYIALLFVRVGWFGQGIGGKAPFFLRKQATNDTAS